MLSRWQYPLTGAAFTAMVSLPLIGGAPTVEQWLVFTAGGLTAMWPASLFAAADRARYRKEGRRITGPLTVTDAPGPATRRLQRFEAAQRR